MPLLATLLTALAALTPLDASADTPEQAAAPTVAPADSATQVVLVAIHDARVAYRAAWAQRQSGHFEDAVETAESALTEIEALLDGSLGAAERRELAELQSRMSGLLDAASHDADAAEAALLEGNEATDDVLHAPATDDIELQMNKDVEKWITYFTGPGRKTFDRWLKRSGKYMDLFQAALRKEGVPPDIAHLVFVESGFNLKARSYARAVGAWQFMRSTGRLFGLTINSSIDERRDPEKSTVAAARYLKHLYGIFHDWPLVLASYNAGEGRLLRSIKGQGTTNYWDLDLPRQTEEYVPKFMAVLHIGRNPKKYGFDKVERDPAITFDEIALEGAVDLHAIAKLAGCHVNDVRELNPAILRNGARGSGNVITVRVPRGSGEQVIAKIEEGENLPKQHLSVTHKVKRGETLSGIASRYRVSANVLAVENRIGRKNFLRTGQVLHIPTAVPPPALAKLEADDPRGSTAYVPPKNIRRPAELDLRGASNPEGRFTVRVRRGESLGAIAERYGVTVADIKTWNRLRSNRVRRGTRLKIRTGPTAAMQLTAADSAALAHIRVPKRRGYSGSIRTTVRVRPGETLGGLARRHGTTVSKLKRANGLRSSRIYAGQRLKIPGTPSSTAGSPPPSGSIRVKSGDTMGSIAKRWGTTVSELKRVNGMTTTRIRAGQTLKLPGGGNGSGSVASSGTVTVQRGDTLTDLAKKHGTTVSAIKRANGLKSNSIRAGQRLKIPAG